MWGRKDGGSCILPEREGEFEIFISLLALAKNWWIFFGKDRCDTYRNRKKVFCFNFCFIGCDTALTTAVGLTVFLAIF